MTSDDEMQRQFRRAAYDAECLTLIDTYGWMIQGVFPTEDTEPEKRYQFCYSVGMSRKELPEFIEYGLPLETGKVVLNQLCREATHDEPYQHGSMIDFQNDYYGVLLQAEDLSDLTLARHFYGHISALQLVFQDSAHRWPNDPEYKNPGLPMLGSFPTTFIERK